MSGWESTRMKKERAGCRRDTIIACLVLVGVMFAYHVASAPPADHVASAPADDTAGKVNVQNLRGAAKFQALLAVLP